MRLYDCHPCGAAAEKADGAAARHSFPAYRDELVTTLLATIDHHPWGRRTAELTQAPPVLGKGTDDKYALLSRVHRAGAL